MLLLIDLSEYFLLLVSRECVLGQGGRPADLGQILKLFLITHSRTSSAHHRHLLFVLIDLRLSVSLVALKLASLLIFEKSEIVV